MSTESEQRPLTLKDLENLKRDLQDLKRDLHNFILEREVASIRWFVATQLAYVVITLGAMYFMLSHQPK